MTESVARIRDRAHYRIHASELAAWLDRQRKESWWSVDGDPILMERLDFPCPPDVLAHEFRQLDRPLLLLDYKEEPTARGELLTRKELDRVAFIDPHGDRAFQFCWEDGPDVDWVLFEDLDTGQRSLGLDDIGE